MSTDEILRTLMPNTYVKYMAQAFDDHAALTAGTSLPAAGLADYADDIPVATVLAVLDNAIELATTDDWYLDFARGMAEHYHGPITMAAVSAPTLGDGLDAFIRFMPTRVPYHRWDRWFDTRYFYCGLTELLDFGRGLPMVIEIPLLVLREYAGRLQRRAADGARVDLRYPPTPHAATYETWFGCEVRFEAPHNAFVIPKEWRAIKNPGFDANNWAAALRQCEETADALNERPVEQRVRDTVLDAIERDPMGSPPTLAAVARTLHVSERTLIRRLAAAGLKYQTLVDDIRKQRASALLLETAMPVYEVGHAVGFRDPASFGRSFRRWFGITPGAYRKRHADTNGT